MFLIFLKLLLIAFIKSAFFRNIYTKKSIETTNWMNNDMGNSSGACVEIKTVCGKIYDLDKPSNIRSVSITRNIFHLFSFCIPRLLLPLEANFEQDKSRLKAFLVAIYSPVVLRCKLLLLLLTLLLL